MNAKEAHEKTLWRKIPQGIREKIENSVMLCCFNVEIHKSTNSVYFDNIQDTIKDLRNLDYYVFLEKKDDDIILKISW